MNPGSFSLERKYERNIYGMLECRCCLCEVIESRGIDYHLWNEETKLPDIASFFGQSSGQSEVCMKLVVDDETGYRNFGDGNSKITSSKKTQ
jgi:hypothetical protein